MRGTRLKMAVKIALLFSGPLGRTKIARRRARSARLTFNRPARFTTNRRPYCRRYCGTTASLSHFVFAQTNDYPVHLKRTPLSLGSFVIFRFVNRNRVYIAVSTVLPSLLHPLRGVLRHYNYFLRLLTSGVRASASQIIFSHRVHLSLGGLRVLVRVNRTDFHAVFAVLHNSGSYKHRYSVKHSPGVFSKIHNCTV